MEGPAFAADSSGRDPDPEHGGNRPANLSRLWRFGPRGGGLTMALIETDASREATAQLDALARDLTERGFETRVSSDGGTLSLSVTSMTMPSLRESIIAAPVDGGGWWFWWSWGDRIACITDVQAAAFKIAYVLTPQAGA